MIVVGLNDFVRSVIEVLEEQKAEIQPNRIGPPAAIGFLRDYCRAGF